ncbi:hypothetical protein KM043_012336 [Ampulex compressa]|nr:hypothetical protein KM043_012336 [Ampulex compressa]
MRDSLIGSTRGRNLAGSSIAAGPAQRSDSIAPLRAYSPPGLPPSNSRPPPSPLAVHESAVPGPKDRRIGRVGGARRRTLAQRRASEGRSEPWTGLKRRASASLARTAPHLSRGDKNASRVCGINCLRVGTSLS